MRFVGVLCAFMTAAACMPQPRNPTEFRAAVKEGGYRRRLEEKMLARDFATAFSAATQVAQRCLNTDQVSRTPGKYGPQTQSVHYSSSSTPVGPDAGELVVQMNGMYILVADLVSTGSGTKLTIYAGGKGGDIIASLIGWAEGTGTACPDL